MARCCCSTDLTKKGARNIAINQVLSHRQFVTEPVRFTKTSKQRARHLACNVQSPLPWGGPQIKLSEQVWSSANKCITIIRFDLFFQFSSMKWNSTYVRYHQNQILVMFRNNLCSFSFLGLVALWEVLPQTSLKGIETQWLPLLCVQIFQAVSKTTTLRDLFKEDSHLGRKCELKKCMSLCPVVTDDLCLCPGTIKVKTNWFKEVQTENGGQALDFKHSVLQICGTGFSFTP